MKQYFILLATLISVLSVAAQSTVSDTIIRMEDGTGLSTSIYLPETGKAFPVLFIRTPYNKLQHKEEATFFCQKGYAVVVQDVRGKYKSTGTFSPFIQERKDGNSSLHWIEKQGWCNGQIGLYGGSYDGFCALSLCTKENKSIKAVFNYGGWVYNDHILEEGGVTNLMSGLYWNYVFAGTSSMRRPSVNMDSLMRLLPVNLLLQKVGLTIPSWEQKLPYRSVNQDIDFELAAIPTLHLTGWYDFTNRGTIQAYEAFRKAGNKRQRLIIGPWYHGQAYSDNTKVGIEDFGSQGRFGTDSVLQLAVNWFDAHLRKVTNLKPEYSISYFSLFDNRWNKATAIPEAGEKWKIAAISEKGKHLFKAIRKGLPGKDTFTYNPSQPVLTKGGANFHMVPRLLGVQNLRPQHNRNDLLIYETDPMPEDISLFGATRLFVSFSTNVPDTDISGRLYKITATGDTAKIITDGIVRCRYRNGRSATDYLIAGKVYGISIHLGYSAFKINKGERLGIEISSSNFPKYERNLNGIEDPFVSDKLQLAHQTIYHTSNQPAFLLLPVMNKQK